MKKFQEGYLQAALRQDPNGGTCAICKKNNDLVDDLGFFYVPIEGQERAICQTCHGPLTGDR